MIRCLNRYYVAEGVRLYSLETWKLIVGTNGRELLAKYMPETVQYYVSQSRADNHAVREVAFIVMCLFKMKVAAL